MARLAYSYQLRQRTDASGNLVVRSDNIAAGLIVLLMGFAWAGLWAALLLDDPGWRRVYDLWDDPFHPGQFDWGSFTVLAVSHGIPLIAIVVGLWLMLAHTRLVFDTRTGLMGWDRVGLFHTSRVVYPLTEVALVLHPKVIPGKAWDWVGFALTLVDGDKRKLELARNRKREPLMAFAAALQERGVELREIEAEDPEARDV